MSDNCLFCRIIAGVIPGDFVYRDNEIVAIRDINPVAPTHILVLPKQHIESVQTLKAEHEGLMGRMILRAEALAEEEGIADRGYRLIINAGPDGGQIVPHLHMHLIGGRSLGSRLS
jgi:histidine triad (HIT) family protein